MPVTDVDRVYYPDLDDVDQPNVYMAVHSQSIEEGIGARLRQQEVAVGLKAGLANVMQLKQTLQLVPFQVNNANANFSQGLTIEGGVVTVKTRGMYLVSAAVGINVAANDSVVPVLYKNSTAVVSAETPSALALYAVGQCTTVINCVPGDTIHVKARCGGSALPTTSPDQTLTHLTVTMIQAVPA